MKKLLFGLIATFMFSFVGSAQTTSKVRPLVCVSVSCCGIGFGFEIDVWHQTTCYWASKGLVKLKFDKPSPDSKVTINEDVLLVGLKSEKGVDLIMPKGTYNLINNEIDFTPLESKQNPVVHCIGGCSNGTIFGYDYSSCSEYCWSWLWGKTKPTVGNLTITPKLTDAQKELLSKGNTEIRFNEDSTFKDDFVNYTLKAGSYTLNQDGNIYIQNIKLN